MAAVMSCGKCGNGLAMADEHCPACGEPVPSSARRAVLVERATALADQGDYVGASRALEPVLKQADLEAAEAKLFWRKRGSWLLRARDESLLDGAEAALAESLRLDDADDLSHQLWIDLLAKRGHLEKAKAWYAQRLQLNPDDVMAQRQQQIIRLSADFKTAPPPTLNIPAGKPSLFAKALKPTTGKLVSAAFASLGSLAQLIWVLQSDGGGALRGDPISGVDQMGSIMNAFSDPWMPGIQFVLFGIYFIWGWRHRGD